MVLHTWRSSAELSSNIYIAMNASHTVSGWARLFGPSAMDHDPFLSDFVIWSWRLDKSPWPGPKKPGWLINHTVPNFAMGHKSKRRYCYLWTLRKRQNHLGYKYWMFFYLQFFGLSATAGKMSRRYFMWRYFLPRKFNGFAGVIWNWHIYLMDWKVHI